jgi:hypothetical protein
VQCAGRRRVLLYAVRQEDYGEALAIMLMQDPEEWLAAVRASLHFDESERHVARILQLRRKWYGGGGVSQNEVEEVRSLENELIDNSYSK